MEKRIVKNVRLRIHGPITKLKGRLRDGRPELHWTVNCRCALTRQCSWDNLVLRDLLGVRARSVEDLRERSPCS